MSRETRDSPASAAQEEQGGRCACDTRSAVAFLVAGDYARRLGAKFMTASSKRRAKKRPASKLWIASVKTVSTFPPEGLFTKSAPVIARTLASKRVSPKGPVSGLRMLTFFINRAGRGLSPSRRAELERAKALLSERIREKNPNGKRRSI